MNKTQSLRILLNQERKTEQHIYMEKQKLQQEEKENKISESKNVWDCGSTLYDSFELNSLKHQLHSAIGNNNSHIINRTLSMSHLPERRVTLLQQSSSSSSSSVMSRKPYKISRSFQKFIRSIFKSNVTSSSNSFKVSEKCSKERLFVVYDKSGSVLSTIPEVPEFEIGSLSPDISSLLVRRSASERFTTTAIGISCG
ncbi:uncharacterized protein LOC123908616 [Trifolium pratense]|uniref:uncharacterized protein LOC123908616 n=1 Tax=Trifolium pratense TaxID=57577 RepID=UPI001E697465|nr:uncharacterized protein LOC123908616 [Trifolium pratense]